MLGHTLVPNRVTINLETTLPPLLGGGKWSPANISSGTKGQCLSPLLSPAFGEWAHSLWEGNPHIPHPQLWRTPESTWVHVAAVGTHDGSLVLKQCNNCLALSPHPGPFCPPGDCKALGQPCLCLAAPRGSSHHHTGPAEPEVMAAWTLCETKSRDIQLPGTSIITLKCPQTPSAFVAENRAEVLPYWSQQTPHLKGGAFTLLSLLLPETWQWPQPTSWALIGSSSLWTPNTIDVCPGSKKTFYHVPGGLHKQWCKNK